MTRFDFTIRWGGLPAGLLCKRTPLGKKTAGWRIDQTRWIAGNGNQLAVVIRDVGKRLLQSDRIGMAWSTENGTYGTDLHDLACVHDNDPLTGLGDHADIVRDDDHGVPDFRLDGYDLFENAVLNEDIQSGGRFIGEDHIRPQDQMPWQ